MSHRSTMASWHLVLVACLAVALPAVGDEVGPDIEPRIDERFVPGTEETPDFRRHVVPLLGRLGCNGRACHGSFQGQGGFRLSLFGYDFTSDHESLVGGDAPRAVAGQPDTSLMLRKPLELDPHEGGHRLDEGSWQHRVLAAWIRAGAAADDDEPATFVGLDVEPRELVAHRRGDTRQLRAVAVWSDGSREDVTPLCRFQSNDDQVATIDEHGLVTAAGPGNGHVVVFYDNGVVPVEVLLPVSDLHGPRFPEVPTPTRIDELVVAKLRTLGEVPADLCSDTEFLRRASLDITGTLPLPEEIEAFLADTAEDKRARKVDELLERPGYAAWWATKFCDWTGANVRQMQNQAVDDERFAAEAWYEWIRSRLERNVPYDEIVEGIVLGRSRLDGESFDEFCSRMSGYLAAAGPAAFADNPSLPYYWSRRNFRTNEERALGFAYTFLGVRIQCAQCHKHPFDQWTQADFDRFENFFARVRYGEAPETKDRVKEMLEHLGVDPKEFRGNTLRKELERLVKKEEKVVPFRETFVVPPPPAVAKKGKGNKPPRGKVVTGRTAAVLGGEEFRIDEMDDPREALMDWLRSEDNPYFATAIVNRVWSGYFNVGIVEPPDNLSLANPPSNAPLLAELTAGFKASGYDLKWLHRQIATSRTYQLGWQTNETNRLDERNFARAVPRRIAAEVIYDALHAATASDADAGRLRDAVAERAIGDVTGQARGSQYALGVFGRSVRDSNCDCDRSMEPSLLQTVYMQNDQELLTTIGRKNGWVQEVVARFGPGSQPPADSASALRKLERSLPRMEKRLATLRETGKDKQAEQLQQQLAKTRQRLESLRAAATPETAPPFTQDEVDAVVRQAYLRTLSRPPQPDELQAAAGYFQETADVAEATRDLLWALLNTKEFVVNH